MKRQFLFNKISSWLRPFAYVLLPLGGGWIGLSACSDFDDYNDGVADATPMANHTLWQNIQQNDELSDFAALVKKTGFDGELNASHAYTVWAPMNGTFDASQYQNLDQQALLRQFVKNHIADYSHQATGLFEERVLMLNDKSYTFGGSSVYTFGENKVERANQPSNNGLLHILNGVVPFHSNLYEYITDSLLSLGKDIDSLRCYVKAYEKTELNEEASVLGPIVNGMQTYVDSVMETSNSLWRDLGVSMNQEDSSYLAVLPSNTAWLKAYDKAKSYFNYCATTKAQTFTNGNLNPTPASLTIDPAYWQDSLACLSIVSNLFFNKNDRYNTWLDGGTPSAAGVDTLRSTNNRKLSNPNDILAQATSTVELSNGKGLIVDSLAMYPWETYAPERSISAASNRNIARVVTGSSESWRLTFDDPEREDFSYNHVIPSGGYGKPELDLYLPNVQSTTYSLYCVFVPPYDDKKAEVLPNRVIFTLNYCDASGNLKDYEFLDESEENISAFQAQFDLKDNSSNRTTIRAFSNNPYKIDTLYIGDFTFPVSYTGLGTEYCPNIKITSPFSVFNKSLTSAFTRDLRIASIILKPKELVEFEESNKK